MSSKTVMIGSALFAASLALAGPVQASSEPGAHVHGEGEINVIVEGKDVLMELTLPGADVVGFEHPADSDKDISAVQAALETLGNANAVFALPQGAGCMATEAHAESSLLEQAEAHGHKDEHKHDSAHEPGHGDFAAMYEFTCANPDALKDIEVKLFILFPSLKEIQVQAVTSKGQWAKELTPADNRFMLAF